MTARRIIWLIVILSLMVPGAVLLWLFTTESGQERLMSLALQPREPFAEHEPPPAPEYSLLSAWASLPELDDKADLRPAGEAKAELKEQASHAVDVFFIHPTTHLSSSSWNASHQEEGARSMLEDGVLRFQTSVYNLCCRVYAPRYRQATLWSFIGEEPDGGEALKLAYGDVRRAFDYFITNYNQGRPFILAAHSQGSFHGMRLLQEVIAARPELARRMIAAYLIGYSIPADMGLLDVPPCPSPEATQCYINWNAVLSTEGREGWLEDGKIWLNGELTTINGRKLACINPLNWQIDGVVMDKSANKGSLPSAGLDGAFLGLVPGLTGARCEQGLLVIDAPDHEGFELFIGDGDYHIYDYNLFYQNLRENIARRIAAFSKEG